MPTTPGWKAAVNTRTTNLNGVNHADQVNQFLGTHAVTPIYKGAPLVTPFGGASSVKFFPGNGRDIAQPFVMPGGKTTTGRVTIPLIPTGNGSDVLVSLVPDSGGVPDTNTILASTTVPASWLTNLTAPSGLLNGGPLATAANNTMSGSGLPVVTWSGVTVDSSGSALFDSATTCSGNFLISAGGLTANVSNAVLTAQFGGTGVLNTPVLQTPLPQGSFLGMLAATTGSLVYTAGNTANPGPTLTTNTYTASWNSNTGAIGTWSLQAALPAAVQHGAAASSGNTVYVAGGVNSSNVPQTGVYFATVNNGQIPSWTTGPPLPVGLQELAMGVVAGWLIVAGGSTTGAGTASNAVYYAKILSDGSLGPWNTGPVLPTAVWTWAPGWNQAVGDTWFAVVSGNINPSTGTNVVQVIAVTSAGLGDWKSFGIGGASGAQITAYFPTGTGGIWDVFMLGGTLNGSNYAWTAMTPLPLISVPLYATGLTPTATYYILIQQHQYRSSSDFISFWQSNGALPGDTMTRSRNVTSGSWTPVNTGFSIPLTVWDSSVVGNPVLHTWEDPTSTGSTYSSNRASRTSSFVYNQLNNDLGVCDSALEPNDPLNLNPTFTVNVANWTPHNCTFVQSNAQTHGGFAFSGLMTPNGVAAAPNVTSDLVPVSTTLVTFGPVQWYVLNGWFYSPTGWSTVSLSVDWYDSTQTFISTTSTTSALTAATWTNIINRYQAVTGASFASINFIESGTPAAANTVFFSDVTLTAANELTVPLSSVNQMAYNGVWPPTGVVQLA